MPVGDIPNGKFRVETHCTFKLTAWSQEGEKPDAAARRIALDAEEAINRSKVRAHSVDTKQFYAIFEDRNGNKLAAVVAAYCEEEAKDSIMAAYPSAKKDSVYTRLINNHEILQPLPR